MKWGLLLTLLLLVSCTIENDPVKVSEFRRGTEGVEFEFVTNRPPNELFEGDSVPVSISLQNRGATFIAQDEPVTVTISYDDYYLSLLGNPNGNYAYSFALLGKSKEFPHGETASELIVGSIRAKELQGQFESPSTDIFVNICYPYQTIFHTAVCVNSDIYYTDERQEICSVEEINDFGGQGGPIAVTKVVPRISLIEDTNGPRPVGPDGRLVNTAYQVVKPVFEIHIKNVNDGISFYSNSDVKEFCKLSSVDRKTQTNKVRVSATLDASENNAGTLDCDVSNVINDFAVLTLRNGEGVVYCMPPNDQTITAEYNYRAQLSVTLDYIYSEGKNKELEIVRKQFG